MRLHWLTLFLIVNLGLAFGQYREPLFKIHDRGNLWETAKDNGQLGGLFSSLQFFPSLDWPGGPETLPSKDEQRSYSQGAGVWIGGKNPDGSVFFNEMGPFTFVDRGEFFEMEEVENFIGSPGFDPNQAEETITARWKTTRGLTFTRVSRAWSFPAFKDFIILEYTITNESGANLTDVFVGFPYVIRPSYQDVLAHNFWGDNLNVDDEIVGYDEAQKILYAYDFYPNESITWSWGNYLQAKSELRTTGYAGFAPLSVAPTKDGAPQPAVVFYAQLIGNSQQFTLSSQSEAKLYKILNGEDNTFQAPEGEVLSPLMLQSFGPYDLVAGQSIQLVIAEAVNGLPQTEAVKGLTAQTKLPAGLDSLRHTIARAQRLFENNYALSVLPPPAPELEFFVLPSTQEIVMTWEPAPDEGTDALTGAKDFRLYRVYRSDRAFTGPFKKMRDVSSRSRDFDSDLGKWKYKDNAIQVGVGYFYAITSIDNAGNESGMTNRNPKAIFTATQPTQNTLNVSVFPNPFRLVSGLPTSGEESSIIFTNLPARCVIRIYTVNGEQVRKLEHDNPNSGEEVWDQLTDSRQKTAAGIYLYTVESDVGSAKGTLLLIK